MLSIRRSMNRNRSKFFFIFCIFFLITFCLIINRKYFHKKVLQIKPVSNHDSVIDRIQAIPILDQKYEFNITYQIKVDDIPLWIYRYKISHLFNFYWLQTGGYKWHLQQIMDLKHISKDRELYVYNQTRLFNDLYHHLEYGVIIDTASDSFKPIFSPLPRTSFSLYETCLQLDILKTWYPCYTKSEKISPVDLRPLMTYGLYNVIIGSTSLSRRIHYDEIIYLFDNQYEKLNETYFVRQILPRYIRLLALVPRTATILAPYFHSKIKYVDQYIDILIQRGVLNDRKRLVKYNPQKTYHAYVVYSTSSPRSDLILLHNILIRNQVKLQRQFILIIRNNLDKNNYAQISQTINQFVLPKGFEYVHIHDYYETSYNIKQISQLFRQATIVIGMPTHVLSHIVWCLPGTHIIEIGQKSLTTDYYEISLELKLHYWLTLTNKTNHLDIIDFRNLMMKVLTELHI